MPALVDVAPVAADIMPATDSTVCTGADFGSVANVLANDYNDHCNYLEGGTMAKDTWTVAEAKAHLSEVLDLAQSGGPQTITRRGQVVAVVVSQEEWRKKTHRTGNLAEFFAASPLREAELTVTRSPDAFRDTDL